MVGERVYVPGQARRAVAVRVSGDDWTCDAVLEPPLNGEDRESLDFLMALDPLFTLCFDGESLLDVNVVAAEDDGRLALTAYQAEAAEPAGTTRQLPQ
ncbi:conserved hypothetical protein [Actinacidiphila cocklensis]|uniref:Uncharacterized protein n=1 Tax=Actinacidiphila cocklensis TaxID=887465 RepID=A0A9W4DR22_9ACTN|nr:conserved hypothetical protein [Actinacidiphila cocklensis]